MRYIYNIIIWMLEYKKVQHETTRKIFVSLSLSQPSCSMKWIVNNQLKFKYTNCIVIQIVSQLNLILFWFRCWPFIFMISIIMNDNIMPASDYPEYNHFLAIIIIIFIIIKHTIICHQQGGFKLYKDYIWNFPCDSFLKHPQGYC